MIRYVTFTGIFVASLAFAGCGNSANSTATDSDSSQVATTTQAAGGQCSAYIAAVRNVCLDNLTRSLDMSCDNQMIAMGVIQQQAAGDLFDAGSEDANAQVVESVCGRYLESLRDKRKKKDADIMPKGSAGPVCTALAARFDSMCMTRLGREPLPDQCRNATRMMGLRALPMEERCKEVDKMLSMDED